MSDHDRNSRENWVGVCPTGKLSHITRRSAKAHATDFRHVGEHLRPYLCGECGFWHVGHLPTAVLYGKRTAASHYKKKRGPQ